MTVLSRCDDHSAMKAPTVSNEKPEVHMRAQPGNPASNQRASSKEESWRPCLNYLSQQNVFIEHEILSKSQYGLWEGDRVQHHRGPIKLQIKQKSKEPCLLCSWRLRGDTDVTYCLLGILISNP